MNLIGETIHHADEDGEEENVSFQGFLAGGVECQKKEEGEDAIFKQVRHLVPPFESQRRRYLRYGRDDENQ